MSEYEKKERLRKIRYWEAKIRVAESHIEKHKKALDREAREQLMEDIRTIIEGFNIEEKERLIDILCDAVLSNFPCS